MALHRESLDKQIVMSLLDETVHTLERDDLAIRSRACTALGIQTVEWDACRDQFIQQLQEAEDWVEREQAIVEAVTTAPPVDSQEGPDFLPSHATMALFQSAFWRLIGLDSAYVNHNFTRPQMTWLEAQLSGPARTLLLTHHHWFSGYRKRGDRLEEWLDAYLAAGRIFGWFWGHDHYLIEYVDQRDVRCRCIGHGSIPYAPPTRRRQTHPVEIVRMETRASPLTPSSGMHGFALLTFDGPVLHIEYVDEQGEIAWTERWE